MDPSVTKDSHPMLAQKVLGVRGLEMYLALRFFKGRRNRGLRGSYMSKQGGV